MNVTYTFQSGVANFITEPEVSTLLPSMDEQGNAFDPGCDERLAVAPAEDFCGLRYIFQSHELI
jgi:hypothetical protein